VSGAGGIYVVSEVLFVRGGEEVHVWNAGVMVMYILFYAEASSFGLLS